MHNLTIKRVSQVVFAIVVCELAGIAGSVFTVSSVSSWYVTLLKPALNPPSWVFGPVWTLLYLLMGISVFLVWENKSEITAMDRKRGLILFFVQLVLNMLWSIFFFGLHNPTLALYDIVALWIAILATMVSFYKISRTAMYLLLPYILWVSFAVYLNYSIVALNI